MFSIPYDGGKIISRILKPKNVRFILPKKIKPKRSDYLKRALKNPVNSKKLEEENFEKPALLIADNTRLPSPYAPSLVRILEKKTDKIKIIVTCGTHPSPTLEHPKKVLGKDLFDVYRKSIIISSTKNPKSKYEYIGKTRRGTEVELNRELLKCDFVLSTLCVRPHYFAGWEGGAKALLPGCSSAKTIGENHSYVIGDPESRELFIQGNKVREDINDVPNLLEEKTGIRHRILDFVPNKDDEPVEVKYGEPVKTHTQLAEFAKKIYQVKTKPSSLIISIAEESLSGVFYQALKAAVHASNVIKYKNHLKPTLILIGKMQGGIGTDVFKKEFKTYMNMEPKKVVQDLRRRVKEGTFNETLQKINRLMMFVPKINFIVVSDKAPKEVECLIREKKIPFFRKLDDALSTINHNLLRDVLIIPEGASTVPTPI